MEGGQRVTFHKSREERSTPEVAHAVESALNAELFEPAFKNVKLF